jgi:hypothetical protein
MHTLLSSNPEEVWFQSGQLNVVSKSNPDCALGDCDKAVTPMTPPQINRHQTLFIALDKFATDVPRER